MFSDMFPADGKKEDTNQKMTIGLMNKRIEYLESQLKNLTHAMIILINSKEKKSSAIVPKHVRYRKPIIFVQWEDHDDDDKQIGIVKIELSE